MNEVAKRPVGQRTTPPEFQTGSFKCPHCENHHPAFVSKCTETGVPIDRAFKMQGEVLEGKYEVGEMLAKGGMGVVYEGRQKNIGRKVAVKFLLSEYAANPQTLQRFQNEARLAASVGHRNIVDIYDLGRTRRGVHYIVMEYLDGRDLGEILDESARLTPHVAIDLAIQVLSALRTVHEQGIIHRDLKPENVFIVARPGEGLSVKILDFGISRLSTKAYGKLNLTLTGTVFGTPGYMAPEQARGSKSIDRRTDLYACGVMLYEMLAGSLPFDAKNYNEMIIAITTEEPTHVARHGVPLPPGLQEIVMKAISREPEARFSSATELFEALRPYRSPEAFEALQAETPGRQSMLDWSAAAGLGQPVLRASLPSNDSAIVPDTSPEKGRPGGYSLVGHDGAVSEDVVRLRSPARNRSASPTPDSIGSQDLIMTLDPSVRPGQTPNPDPATSGWHEYGAAADETAWSLDEVVERSHREFRSSYPSDPSISLDGWVGPISVAPPRSRRGPVPRWLLVAAAGVLLLLASGTLTFGIVKARGIEKRMDTVRAANGSHAPATGLEVSPGAADAPGKCSLVLEGLPDGAEVYVDGMLHPERPVIVEDKPEPRLLRVVAAGHQVWEKRVAVRSDTEMTVNLTPLPENVEIVNKKSSRKKGQGKKRPKIDKTYPGLI